jgi:hypothetical protein
MKRTLFPLLALALCACAEAQLVPIGQPIRVDRLPACTIGRDGLAFQVIDSNGASECAGGGTTIGFCACRDQTWSLIGGDASDHGMLVGLADDDHLQYALLAGRLGEQVLHGGVNDDERLFISPNAEDDLDQALIFLTGSNPTPSVVLQTRGGTSSGTEFRMEDTLIQGSLGNGGHFRMGFDDTAALYVDKNGNVGLDGRLRIGDSDLDSASSCIDVSTDRLFGDLDCDSTKDAGEQFLDDEVVGKYVLATNTSTTAIETTGAGADLDFDSFDDFFLTATDDLLANTTGASGVISLSTVGSTATITLQTSGGTAAINVNSASSANVDAVDSITLDVAGGNGEISLGDNTAIFTALVTRTPQTATCTSDGTGAAGALTLLPTANLIEITNSDPDGCAVTMDESGMSSGVEISITVVATAGGNVSFADTSGLTELTGAVNLGLYDSLDLGYTTSRYVMRGTSNN